MKKLVLALVCLVSVAFFASCNPEGNPTISVLQEEGYAQDGDVINLGDTVYFGFQMSSALETNSTLVEVVVNIDGEEFETVDLTGETSYTYRGAVIFGAEKDSIMGEIVISAVVVDAVGAMNTASITLTYKEVEDVLIPTEFSWNRHGSAAATGNLADLGLAWNGNTKESFVILTPLEGAAFYRFDTEAERDLWGSITTATEKAALFSENLLPITEFKEISAWASHDYNFVLGTVYNGEYNLIHITKGEVSTFKGTDVTISGEWK